MLTNLIANERAREMEIRQQERQQGIEQEKQVRKIEVTETVKSFLGMGLPVEQVAKGMSLTVEEVERIKNELSGQNAVVKVL